MPCRSRTFWLLLWSFTLTQPNQTNESCFDKIPWFNSSPDLTASWSGVSNQRLNKPLGHTIVPVYWVNVIRLGSNLALRKYWTALHFCSSNNISQYTAALCPVHAYFSLIKTTILFVCGKKNVNWKCVVSTEFRKKKVEKKISLPLGNFQFTLFFSFLFGSHST